MLSQPLSVLSYAACEVCSVLCILFVWLYILFYFMRMSLFKRGMTMYHLSPNVPASDSVFLKREVMER